MSYRHQLDAREILSKLHANFWDNPIDDDRSKWVVGLGGGKHKETEGSDVDEGCFTRDFGIYIRPFDSERNLGTQRYIRLYNRPPMPRRSGSFFGTSKRRSIYSGGVFQSPQGLYLPVTRFRPYRWTFVDANNSTGVPDNCTVYGTRMFTISTTSPRRDR